MYEFWRFKITNSSSETKDVSGNDNNDLVILKQIDPLQEIAIDEICSTLSKAGISQMSTIKKQGNIFWNKLK